MRSLAGISRGLAIMADTGAALLVVANALRLLRSSDQGFYGGAPASLSTFNYASSDPVGSVWAERIEHKQQRLTTTPLPRLSEPFSQINAHIIATASRICVRSK